MDHPTQRHSRGHSRLSPSLRPPPGPPAHSEWGPPTVGKPQLPGMHSYYPWATATGANQELRRLRADLCLCYKILHGHLDTPVSNLFELDKSRQTRGHSWRLKVITPRLDSRLQFYSMRVVNPWNSLSQNTVDATSFGSFKALLQAECLDKFLVKTSG